MTENRTDLWVLENARYSDDIQCICGVDEAGRGPLAGPVYAAAVILPRGLMIEGLNDSKKLTEKRRDALSYGIGSADEKEIDEINILQATFLAMRRAISQLSIRPDLALIDGNRDSDFGVPAETVIGGDGKSANIAAASILAKVTRDRVMLDYAAMYPQYGFDVHKGYGTKRHYEALREYGPCPIHRQSFLRKFYEHG